MSSKSKTMNRLFVTLFAISVPGGAFGAPGLIAEYFKLPEKLGDEYEVPIGLQPWLVRIDKQVNFPETPGEFYGSKLSDQFMVRWSGTLNIASDGDYKFLMNSDDGSRLSIDDQLVVENWGPHSMTKKSGSITLRPGSHRVTILYQEGGVEAGCIAGWIRPGGKEEPIPASILSHDPKRLKAIKWDPAPFAKAPTQTPPLPVRDPGMFPARFGSFAGNALRVGQDTKGDNLVFRGQIIRLNEEGSACIVFDADTMRMAAGWTKGGLQLKGGPISGGNDVFPLFVGEALFTNAAAPGWAKKDGSLHEPRIAEDGAYPPLGPLPKTQAHYRGLYAHGDKVVLRYTVGKDSILEMPALENGVITRTIQGTFSRPATMVLAKVDGAPKIRIFGADLMPTTGKDGIVLQIPAGRTHLKIAYGNGVISANLEDLTLYTKGGPSRFPETVTTKGEIAQDDGTSAYLLDRLTLPYENPYGMKMRIGGFDFFTSDPSRAAVCTWDGDVWIVSGIDEKLEKLQWKRFAAGGHETLGLTIVDDVIYTVGDDQITRYHDLNGDDEADYHENFNNDWELTTSFHEFCFDLQRAPNGDFYFAYGSPVLGGGLSFSRMGRHHGSIIRVSKDGSEIERYATGLRAPNGIGMSPTGQITCGDNEGTFVPRCPIHWIDKDEFLGVVDAAANYAKMNTTTTVAQRRGKRDKHLDPGETPVPLAWLPKSVDNSNGGQVWVTSKRWGPFQGEMLHLSYGQSALYLVLKQKCGDVMQGGVVRIPVSPTSSAMRGRFNKRDGQLYMAGLRGWQTNAGREGGLDRVRYTGRKVKMPSALEVRDGGIMISFTEKLDKALAEDPASYALSGSDLRWTHAYGTSEYQTGHRNSDEPPKGRTRFTVESARLLPDGKSVFLKVTDLRTVHMMEINIDLETESGDEIVTKIWNTIHVTE